MLAYLLCLSVFALPALSGNVLITFAHDFSSHINSMKPFFIRLSQAGHNVTVLDTSSSAKPRSFGPRINVFHIHLPPKDDVSSPQGIYWTMQTKSSRMPALFAETDKVVGELIDEHSEELSTVLNTHWDLIVMDELFGLHQNAIAYHLKQKKNTPYIVFATSMIFMTNYINNALGRFSSSRMGMFLPVPVDSDDVWDPQIFTLRLNRFVNDVVEHIGMRYYLTVTGGFENVKRLTNGDFDFQKFTKESSFHLTEQIDRTLLPLPEGTDFKLIGSHCGSSKPLPDEYRTFIEDPNSKGTIYVAFGSVLDLSYAPAHIWNAFEEAFAELTDYRIIVTYGGEKKFNVGPHVMITKWAPQFDVLSHEKTHLFVSHGGLKSMKEAICSRTPVLYMPVFAEQAMNTRMALEIGFARTVNKFTVNKASLLNEIHTILDNYDEYDNKIHRLYDTYMDRIIPALDEGVFYAERVMTGHGDREPFKRRGIDLGWVDHLYADFAVLFLVLYAVLK